MSEFSVIGKSVPRPDAVDKVTGGRGFPVNVELPGMLHAKLYRSPYPHARILSIDTSAAEALPGVKAVLVPEEVPNIKYSTVFFTPTFAKSMVQDMLILSDTVRYVGQPIAAVAVPARKSGSTWRDLTRWMSASTTKFRASGWL